MKKRILAFDESRTKSNLKFDRILVTPDEAKDLLLNNTQNRSIKEELVMRYSRDMKAGKWEEDTGETIKISKTGRVLDGQHRLLAIIHSGVSVYMHFTRNVPEKVFSVLDTGSVRNASDVFKIDGIRYAKRIPSMITSHAALKFATNANMTIRSTRFTNGMLLDAYKKRPEFWQDVATKANVWYGAFNQIIRPSLFGGMYAMLSEINAEDAENFMNQLSTGENVTNRMIIELRNQLIKDLANPRKMPASLKNALILKTWNFYRRNATLKTLKFDTVNETFPLPI